MDGLAEESVCVLQELIIRSEEHRDQQMKLLHDLTAREQSAAEALQILGEIEDSLAALRSRRAYLRMLAGTA